MSRWTRPYSQRELALRRAMIVLGSVIIWSFLLCTLLYPVTNGSTAPGQALAALAVTLVMGGLFQAFSWRMAGQGVDVGEPGIRLRWFFHSQVIPWGEVHRVVVVDDPRYRNRVLVVIDRYGTRIPTPICEFALRFVRRPGPSMAMLRPAELDALGQRLDAMAAERRRQVSA